MKEDLKRLINEFIDETKEGRTEIIEEQNTESSPTSKKEVRKPPTFQDFIYWLNDSF